MKRAAVLIVLLVFVAGLLFLLFEDGAADRRDRRGTGADAPGAANATAGASIVDDTTGDGAVVDEAHMRDDDPNRVDGPRLRIRGRVLAKDEPVTGALVEILRAPPAHLSRMYLWQRPIEDTPAIAHTKSTDGGHFEAGIARRTVAVIRASAPGHAPATMRVLLPEEGDIEDITLRLGEPGAVRGVVVSKDDEPVANATVHLSNNDRQRATVSYETTTAEDGTFAVEDLARSNYQLTVTAEGYGSARRWANAGADQDVRVVLGPACVIEGTITFAGGTPIPALRVTFETRDSVNARAGSSGEATTDETGRFRISDMQAGHVTLVKLEGDRVGLLTTTSGAIQLKVATAAPDAPLTYDIELPAGTTVTGRAVLADGREPVPGAHIALLRLVPRSYSLTDAAHTVADAQGRFSFPYVTEGGYAIEAKGNRAARLVQRWMGMQRGVVTDFYADGKTTPAERTVELTATGSIDGRVRGLTGTPRGFGVNVQTTEGQVNGVVDDLLHFRFAHVPAAPETQVSAWNPSLKSKPFTVEAGKTAEVTLDAGDGRGFTGIVRDEAGRPLAGAKVIALPEMNLRWQLQQFLGYGGWGSASTGADGRFRYPIPEWMSKTPHSHKWIVLAKHDGYMLGEAEGIKVPKDGEPPEVEITLRKGGVVSGRLEALGGGPIAGARVTLQPRKQKGVPIEKRQQLAATTDIEGKFEIRGVEDGPYQLSVFHRDGKVASMEVTSGTVGLRLELKPTAAIRGVIIDEAGNPLAQNSATVTAIVPTEKGERKQGGSLLTGGRFQILNLEPGAYVIEVAPGGNSSAVQAGFVKKRTEPIATGTEDTVIQVEPGPRIRGRVIGPGGKGLAGVTVIAMPLKPKKNPARAMPASRVVIAPNASSGTTSDVSNSRGEFELRGVSEEQVELVAVSRGYSVASAKAVAGDSRVTLRMSKGESIEALVLLPDGRPCRQAWFNVQPQSRELQVKLQSWQQRGGQAWNRVGGWQLTQGRTGIDGRLEMTGLEPGKYQLWLHSTDGVLADNVLETGRGSVTLQLQTPFTVSGRVTDAEGKAIVIPPGQMGYVSAQSGTRHLNGAQIGSDGTFELTGLPAGELKLRIWAPGHSHATVTVEAGATDVHITLQPVKKPKKKTGG